MSRHRIPPSLYDPKESQNLEARIDEAITAMVSSMRRGRRVVAIRKMYKDIIRTDELEKEDQDEDQDEDENP